MHEWKVGEIARYADGSSAFFRLEALRGTDSGPRWYGSHIMSGVHGSAVENLRELTDEDREMIRKIKPKWLSTTFEVGDVVRKHKGDYTVRGTVIAAPRLFGHHGKWIIVVRIAAEQGYFCHIFSPEQLQHV